ncbi:hypothetical protein [Bradyrhizobium sp. 62]|uniref:hypothetical protein n=1 Tax=Bradyrhizobium sp. 62 TaxID=1043588 RepID=UPI001FFA2897|nr:hypothetical protein [Bradyrhizobium sp. 62]MCK1368018.1 hypothetical protein [Bradyrhizobium sp. 62]
MPPITVRKLQQKRGSANIATPRAELRDPRMKRWKTRSRVSAAAGNQSAAVLHFDFLLFLGVLFAARFAALFDLSFVAALSGVLLGLPANFSGAAFLEAFFTVVFPRALAALKILPRACSL